MDFQGEKVSVAVLGDDGNPVIGHNIEIAFQDGLTKDQLQEMELNFIFKVAENNGEGMDGLLEEKFFYNLYPEFMSANHDNDGYCNPLQPVSVPGCASYKTWNGGAVIKVSVNAKFYRESTDDTEDTEGTESTDNPLLDITVTLSLH